MEYKDSWCRGICTYTYLNDSAGSKILTHWGLYKQINAITHLKSRLRVTINDKTLHPGPNQNQMKRW